MAAPVTVVNPWHWLDEDGGFPDDPKLRSRALRVAQCIEYGGTLAIGEGRQTLIPCRRRPDGLGCPGLMWVLMQSDEAILAFCEVCQQDEFLIYEWEDTPWALGQAEPLSVAAAHGGTLPEPIAEPERRDEQLQRALQLVGSPLRAAEIRRRIAAARSPSEVVQAIVASCPQPPDMRSLERVLPVLIDAWNETPRPELGGRAPRDVQSPAASAKVGRNAPCPCGSGKKYKRCCGAP